MALWNTLLLIAGAAVLAPMIMWSLECAAALLPPRRLARSTGARRPRVAILVPAHNEAGGIGVTLASLTPQVLPGDRVVVIADNCTDPTAAVSREAGVEVLERCDVVRRGKSYALDYGVRALRPDPPDVVVMIDADCTAEPGAVERMARLAFASGRPVQASYLLAGRSSIASLAFLVKNLVRPAGLDRLGLPCFLHGSGMAFPWSVIQLPVLASGRITEDTWLTVDLALAGHTAVFVRDALVTGRLPDQEHAAQSQRRRWLHGHLECMLIQGPRLLLGAIRQKRLDLFGLAFDLSVPPLSLLTVLWLLLAAVTVASGLLGRGWMPALPPAAGGVVMAAVFRAVLAKFGREEMRGSLRAGPSYVLAKLPLYGAFLTRREKDWIRTGRDPVPPPE